MTRLKALVREPALLIDLAETLVVILVAYGIADWDKEQQGYLVAAVIALAAVGKGFSTRPFPVTVLTDATRAILVVAASVFGAGLSADQIALTATLVGTLFSVVARAQITPVKDPVVVPGGAGAGPVTEAGFISLTDAIFLVIFGAGAVAILTLPFGWAMAVSAVGIGYLLLTSPRAKEWAASHDKGAEAGYSDLLTVAGVVLLVLGLLGLVLIAASNPLLPLVWCLLLALGGVVLIIAGRRTTRL